MSERQHFTDFVFWKVPAPELGGVIDRVLANGWVYERSLPLFWTARFGKYFPEGTSADEVEAEVQAILGAYYMPPNEIDRAMYRETAQSAAEEP